MLSIVKCADLLISCKSLRSLDLKPDDGAYDSRVPKRSVSTAVDQQVPMWRQRIRRAVAPRGELARIARKAKMPSTQLQKIENGSTKDPGISTIERIAVAMGTTLRDLVDPRPDGGTGHEDRVGGGAVLEQIVAEANAQDGSVEADVAQAIALLVRALERQHSRSPTDREAEDARRGTVTTR